MIEQLFSQKLTEPENGLGGLEMRRGLDLELALQLINKSWESEIYASCPNDADKRFKDLGSLEEWLSRERQVYPLVDEQSQDLGGIIWHGPKPFPKAEFGPQAAQDTFAIRLYKGYRGRGLAEPFMKNCLWDYVTTVVENGRAGYFHGIWLSSRLDRKGAQVLFRRFGYQEIGRDSEEVFMLLSPEKIRQIIGGA
jgi:hypothetical protein